MTSLYQVTSKRWAHPHRCKNVTENVPKWIKDWDKNTKTMLKDEAGREKKVDVWQESTSELVTGESRLAGGGVSDSGLHCGVTDGEG